MRKRRFLFIKRMLIFTLIGLQVTLAGADVLRPRPAGEREEPSVPANNIELKIEFRDWLTEMIAFLDFLKDGRNLWLGKDNITNYRKQLEKLVKLSEKAMASPNRDIELLLVMREVSAVVLITFQHIVNLHAVYPVLQSKFRIGEVLFYQDSIREYNKNTANGIISKLVAILNDLLSSLESQIESLYRKISMLPTMNRFSGQMAAISEVADEVASNPVRTSGDFKRRLNLLKGAYNKIWPLIDEALTLGVQEVIGETKGILVRCRNITERLISEGTGPKTGTIRDFTALQTSI